MNKWKTLAEIRRDYGSLSLEEERIDNSPFIQFERWFAEVMQIEKTDPTAMVLSTVDEQGHPDSRVVLLKGIEQETFLFYTNYQSTKAKQINKNPYAALNFHWPEMARQIRVRGPVKPTTSAQSDAYFASRPKMSQLSAIASPQSNPVKNRASLEQRLNDCMVKYQQHDAIERPSHWGGYCLIPDEMEFWQGRDNRLHDRIHYFRQNKKWLYQRLAP